MMLQIDSDQITKRFLILGVALVAIKPRMPFDRTGFTVGGNLSHGFRKLLLGIVAVNFCRLVLAPSRLSTTEEEYGRLFSDLLGVVEVTALTLLCFLTPYVLETSLSHFTNLTPGRGFYCPLIAATFLSLLGVILSRTVHPNLWCLKKLANAVSGPPVITVLRQFNLVSSFRSHGNGFIMGQAVLTTEYWHFVLQLTCAVGYALQRPTRTSSGVSSEWDAILEAARESAFLADWVRVLMHALFLNYIDEMNHFHSFESSDASERDEGSPTSSGHSLVKSSRAV